MCCDRDGHAHGHCEAHGLCDGHGLCGGHGLCDRLVFLIAGSGLQAGSEPSVGGFVNGFDGRFLVMASMDGFC